MARRLPNAPAPATPAPAPSQRIPGNRIKTEPLNLVSSAPAANPSNPNNKPAAPVLPPQTGPIFPDQPAQPISFGTNGQHYNPTTAPHGMDMSAPGVQEQFWNNNQQLWLDDPNTDWVESTLPQYQDPWFGEQTNQQLAGTIANPGAGQQYWNGIAGQANTMTGAESSIAGGYKGPNNAQTAFDITKGRLPDSFQPQFDAYYDRMKQKTMGDVNSQSAARGAYGSNAALNNSIGAGLDIEAQRAKASTDFMFQDSANQRNWLDSLSGQGRSADLSGQGAFGLNIDAAKFGLDKTKTYGDLAFDAERMDFDKKKTAGEMAFGVDEHRQSRLDSGTSAATIASENRNRNVNDTYDAAGDAQDAREGRINELYGQNANFSNDVVDFLGENFDKLLGADGQMNEQEMEALIAQTADERGWNDQQKEVFARDIKGIISLYKASQTGQ